MNNLFSFVRSLRFRIAATFSIVFILITTTSIFFIYERVKQELIQTDTNDILNKAYGLLGKIQSDVNAVPLPSAGERIRLQRRVLDPAREEPILEEKLFNSPGFPSLTRYVPPGSVVNTDTFRVAVVTRVISQSSQIEVELALARSGIALKQKTIALRNYLFAANAMAILLSAVMAYFISGLVFRPLRRIIQGVKQIKAAESMRRLPVPGTKDEVALLASTMNEMLERIEQTINNQTNFFGSAAHELRTPLSVMRVELEVALQGEVDPGRKELLQSQLEEILRLSRLVQDFLLVSRLKSNSLTLSLKEKEQLDELVLEAAKSRKRLMESNGNSLQFHLEQEQEIPALRVDADKMVTVFANLLENAAKYSKPNSAIKVNMTRQQDTITVKVTNEVAKAVEHIEKLLDEYYREDVFTQEGMGLGLWISRQLVMLHHGNLHLKQQEHFFEVSVSLPLSRD